MMQSPSLSNLGLALAAAQSVMRPALKEAINPHFKSRYADLASVWEACRDPLASNGLSVLQLLNASGAVVTVTTLLLHKSGEFIGSDLALTSRDATPQGIASCVTYGRRMGLSALVGVCSDDDDDGNSTRPKESHAPPPPRPQTPDPQVSVHPPAPAPAAGAPKLNDTQRYNVAAALIRKKMGDGPGGKLIADLTTKYAAPDGKVPDSKRAELLADIEATAKGDAK